MSYLQLRNVIKRFGQTEVVKDLSLEIKKGELISFLGPSGCGKTTTLNMIAGFLDVDGGSIWVDGTPVHQLPPYKRNMGMVFQNYALFPHMTVSENVAFGLKLRKVPRAEMKERVQSALAMTRLDHFKDRYPKELSGGQQQRVAISRALAIQPTVLLLDEPLSNLDAKLRREMREEIVDIRKRVDITMIFVTHDQEEALAISDRIAVINGGRVEQVDVPQAIYNHPKTAFVAGFIGEVNKVSNKALGLATGERTDAQEEMFYIRPENVKVSAAKPARCPSVKARLERRIFLGAKTRLILSLGEDAVIAEIPTFTLGDYDLSEKDELYIYWQPEDLLSQGMGR